MNKEWEVVDDAGGSRVVYTGADPEGHAVTAISVGWQPSAYTAILWFRDPNGQPTPVWRCDHLHESAGQAEDCARAQIAETFR